MYTLYSSLRMDTEFLLGKQGSRLSKTIKGNFMVRFDSNHTVIRHDFSYLDLSNPLYFQCICQIVSRVIQSRMFWFSTATYLEFVQFKNKNTKFRELAVLPSSGKFKELGLFHSVGVEPIPKM
jgi:hypothetical protein